MDQDFTRRLSIVINRELPFWQVLNTVSHIAAYFGNKLGDDFDTGDFFETEDGTPYPRNSQYAIIALAASANEMKAFERKSRSAQDVKSMFFIREMIETTSDAEIEEMLSTKTDDQVEVLGIGVFGENQRIKELTKHFKLWS